MRREMTFILPFLADNMCSPGDTRRALCWEAWQDSCLVIQSHSVQIQTHSPSQRALHANCPSPLEDSLSPLPQQALGVPLLLHSHSSLRSLFFNFNVIQVWLSYSAVLVSGIQLRDSVIQVRIFSFFRFFSQRLLQYPEQRPLCSTVGQAYLFYIQQCIYIYIYIKHTLFVCSSQVPDLSLLPTFPLW